MKNYKVTHFGFRTESKNIKARTPREASTKAFGPMGDNGEQVTKKGLITLFGFQGKVIREVRSIKG